MKKQEDAKTNEMANPEESAEYNPRADVRWWQLNLTYPRMQKLKYRLIEITIFIVVVSLVVVVAVPMRSGIIKDQKWAEAETIMGVIGFAVNSYKYDNNGDISGLDEPKGALKEGFVSTSNLLPILKLEAEMFDNMEYFDAEDFMLEFTTDGKDGSYSIIVDAKKGGGTTGKGPEGKVTYKPDKKQWKRDY